MAEKKAKKTTDEYVLVVPKRGEAKGDTRFSAGQHPSVLMRYDKAAKALRCPAVYADWILSTGRFVAATDIPKPSAPESE